MAEAEAEDKKSKNGSELRPLQKLRDYKEPAMPTEESFRQLIQRAKKVIKQENEKPFIADGDLQSAVPETLESIAAPPAWGPLLDEIALSLGEWLEDEDSPEHTKLIVIPPCDYEGILARWAEDNAHQTLTAPARLSHLGASSQEFPLPEGDGPIVIPCLEHWFLRHHRGLSTVRSLLKKLYESERRCVIGCNSFAWRYLERAIGADLLLPVPFTLQPFDADRLAHWFKALDHHSERKNRAVRLSQTGKDIFEKNEDGALNNDYFANLAANSRGIPWIAWTLWRGALRSDRSKEQEADDGEENIDIPKKEEDTLWVVSSNPYHLPNHQRQSSLLILHALLIHGSLTAEELALVVPIVGESYLIAGLINCRFIELEKSTGLRCCRAAYPTIRTELASAGLPVDQI